jgi:putative Mg2+ transporter-C (MgtC) family protein
MPTVPLYPDPPAGPHSEPVSTALLILAQVGAAVVLGAAVGLERELSAQPAGLRSHMLVALGAAVFTIGGARTLTTNPTVLAVPVVGGVGFLGGGAILREGTGVRGLTTAASLWVTAAVGIAIGLRLWLPAVSATTIAIVVLVIVRKLEHEILPHRRPMEITLTLTTDAAFHDVEIRAREYLSEGRVLRVNYTGTDHQILIVAKPRDHHRLSEIAEKLRSLDGVQGVEMLR